MCVHMLPYKDDGNNGMQKTHSNCCDNGVAECMAGSEDELPDIGDFLYLLY